MEPFWLNMASEKKKDLIKRGYEEDVTYPGKMWGPFMVGNRAFPRPEWMRQKDSFHGYHGIGERADYRGKAYHLMRFGDCFFSDPLGAFHMEWNPNAVKIVDEFFKNRFLAVMGAKSSSKSFTLSGLGCLIFLLDPLNTKVLVTSTTVDTAKGKIWGDIGLAWTQVERVFRAWSVILGVNFPAPGKLISSPPSIRCEIGDISSMKMGLELVPTQAGGGEKQSVEKVQGYKQQNVVFLGDEWDTLPQGLSNTVKDNLSGNPNSRCIAAFNPTGRSTSGGRISKPKAGWDSITIDDEEWETEFGKCIRFDATKSPNLLPGATKIWKGLMTHEKMDEEISRHGSQESAGWYTFIRAWFPPMGELDCIYSEAEVFQYLGDHKVSSWLDQPKKIAGLDPSFTHGGDSAILVIAQVGTADINGIHKRVYEKLKTINLDHFITDKTVAKDEQVVSLVKRFIEEEGVEVGNLGVDITGAPSFGSLLSRQIGTGWLGVHSSNKPTELVISKSDTRKCRDVFDSLMSELWYVGRPLLREGQIRGLDSQTIEEMSARTYKAKGSTGKVEVEEKRKMKSRTGHSPDRSDATFISLHVARVRHSLSSTEKAKNLKAPQERTQLDRFYESNPHMKPKKRRQREVWFEALESGLQGW